MHKPGRMLLVMIVVGGLLLPLVGAGAQAPETDFKALIEVGDVMRHVQMLAVTIGPRPMGSAAEEQAAEYIAAELAAYGYAVDVQPFEAGRASDGGPVMSRNVIATRRGADESFVVIGAHLDSVTAGQGAGDNASGVAALLAAAEALAGVETAHTLVFAAFGAEETGAPSGAEVYVEQLGDRVTDVVAMLNVDSVGMGTYLYVYAGATNAHRDTDGVPVVDGGPVWVRDLALSLAAEMRLPFRTSPDTSWGGFINDWSDHAPFVQAGVPVAYFEAWDWSAEHDPWWGQETSDGDLMHSEQDVYANVVPDKVEQTAELVAATVAALGNSARP